jgi:ADP-L-glycero-D-manno-heptose 6-epimerase
MKLLITGSKGFIAQNLIENLSPTYEIDTFDISDEYIRPEQLNVKKYDCVLHIGAISSTTETDVQKVMDLNVSWPIELFEECINHNTKFQWSSSASVYGKTISYRETQKPNPQNLYARSKTLLENYISMRDAPIVWQGFRYFNVYGKGEDHKGTQASPHAQFTKQAKETGIIKIFEGSDSFFRDFVPVETVCDYHKKFLTKNVSGIFNIGTGTAKSFLQVAEEIALQHNAKIETIQFPANLINHYQTYTCADMSFTDSLISL